MGRVEKVLGALMLINGQVSPAYLAKTAMTDLDSTSKLPLPVIREYKKANELSRKASGQGRRAPAAEKDPKKKAALLESAAEALKQLRRWNVRSSFEWS